MNHMKSQIKAGRVLLGLSQAQLCEAAGVPLITLRRIEGKPDHDGLVSLGTVRRVVAALERRGVQFLNAGQAASGPGVAIRATGAESSDQ